MHRHIFIAKYMLFQCVLPWAGQVKHPLEIYGARAGYNYIGHIFVLPPQWGYVSVCEIVGRPSCISLSLSLSCWWMGLVTLEGEFCGSSFNILEIEGDIKCIFPLFHTEEQYSSHSLHTCRTAALVPEFAMKDLPLGRTLWWWWWWWWWYINSFGRFISLIKYWWAHPIKWATSRHWKKAQIT